MNETLEKFKLQHQNNYKKALLENIKNNTTVLFNDDISSLLKKPPLDSMDLLKKKFLDIAKKNKIILNTEILDRILNSFREDIVKCCVGLKMMRINKLSEKINEFNFDNDNSIIKINKKDFLEINKIIKKEIKEQLNLSLNSEIINKMDDVFFVEDNFLDKEKIKNEISKFISGNYQKQLLENVDFKILVKDTTLMNGIKEQSERYLFTLNNSRLFNDKLDT